MILRTCILINYMWIFIYFWDHAMACKRKENSLPATKKCKGDCRWNFFFSKKFLFFSVSANTVIIKYSNKGRKKFFQKTFENIFGYEILIPHNHDWLKL